MLASFAVTSLVLALPGPGPRRGEQVDKQTGETFFKDHGIVLHKGLEGSHAQFLKLNLPVEGGVDGRPRGCVGDDVAAGGGGGDLEHLLDLCEHLVGRDRWVLDGGHVRGCGRASLGAAREQGRRTSRGRIGGAGRHERRRRVASVATCLGASCLMPLTEAASAADAAAQATARAYTILADMVVALEVLMAG